LRYPGSKYSIFPELEFTIFNVLGFRPSTWVEPFVGGGNSIHYITGRRIGIDSNPYLIALHKALQSGWIPPAQVSHLEYQRISASVLEYPQHLVGYVGFCCTFGSRFFGGYARSFRRGEDVAQAESLAHLLKTSESLRDVEFHCMDYLKLRGSKLQDLGIPPGSVIYCDPPYVGTKGYSDIAVNLGISKPFNSDQFWETCREWSQAGYHVFVSEQQAPPDFTCIYFKSRASHLKQQGPSTLVEERLFYLKP